jgi:hypothetical protein
LTAAAENWPSKAARFKETLIKRRGSFPGPKNLASEIVAIKRALDRAEILGQPRSSKKNILRRIDRNSSVTDTRLVAAVHGRGG